MARGNVLVMAGAGTGKTHTLVERCLDLICNEQVSLDEMLIVTFTEAAATEVRERLRKGLEEAIKHRPDAGHLPEQLALFDAAHIGTLHSFCFKLIRGHFHALGLDPQLSVLDEAQARLLADEILEEQFQAHYEYAGDGNTWLEAAPTGRQDACPAAVTATVSTQIQQSNNPSIQNPSVPAPTRVRKGGAARKAAAADERQLDFFIRPDVAPIIQQSNNPLIQNPVVPQPARHITAVRDETGSAFSLAVQDLITVYGNGRDDGIRALVLRLHRYIQTRADAEIWLARQIESFSSPEPTQWREWYLMAVQEWREEWLPVLKALRPENVKAAECLEVLEKFPADAAAISSSCASLFERIAAADGPDSYPPRSKTVLRKPLERFFDDAEFLGSLAVGQASCLPVEAASSRVSEGAASTLQRLIASGAATASTTEMNEDPPSPGCGAASEDDSPEPLREDWEWSRGRMKTLLLLVNEFSAKFSARKRTDGVVDFHDLEQFAIRLVRRFEDEDEDEDENDAHGVQMKGATAIAAQWREKLRFIFVDEYQDINAAQDRIISALGRDNRFLVGDVKQSIYRFRLADPAIFRNYAKNPESWNAGVIALRENFRSREGLLDFVNSVFESLMSEGVGGVPYDEQAKLQFGAPEERGELSVKQNPGPRVEMLLREKKRRENADAGAGDDPLGDLQEAELEARMVARRLRELKESGHLISDNGEMRSARWSDFAVLLRSPASKREIYAKQFANAGVPLHVERGGFYDSSEISDLLSLLQLADNPLQDVPCIAVLRSPLVSCSLDELAEIRMAAHGHFWFALNRAAEPGSGVRAETRLKIEKFLGRFSRWRILARQASLSECLEEILTETHYDDWLLSRPRGEERRANVRRFLHLAGQFDSFQRQGLFRFLRFVNAQREIEAEPEVTPLAGEGAVRLMSIHQSKGLEFPVVVLADLGKAFNEQDLRGEIILDEKFGLCPRVKPPSSGGRYPSLAYWLARKHQRRELRGEEMRLLYVALTRAQDTQILSGGFSPGKWEAYFEDSARLGLRDILLANSCMDWVGMWMANAESNRAEGFPSRGETRLMRWRVVEDSELGGEPIQTPTGQRPADLEIGNMAGSETCATGGAWDEAALKKIDEVVTWKYPFELATKGKAKKSVTELRREAAEADDEAEQLFRPPLRPMRVLSRQRDATKLNAADTGLAHHKFLQHFSFETVKDLKSFADEAKRLEKENYLSAEEAEALDLEALADFWISDVGKAIRTHASHVRRELAFTAGFKPSELDEMFGREPDASLNGETIVVQGVADLVVLLPKEIWLVDFKTDDVRAKDLPEKIEIYSPQLKLYARALERIYSRPVTSCRLHFLAVRRTVVIPR